MELNTAEYRKLTLVVIKIKALRDDVSLGTWLAKYGSGES